MPGDRRQARIVAMQAMCQWDVQRDESPQWVAAFMLDVEASGKVTRRASGIVEAFLGQRVEIDRRLGQASPKWSLSRMSPVVRNAMRVAMVEWLVGKTPPKVALNEAIEIAREYADEDAVRFVNGILDSALKRLTAESENDDGSDGQGDGTDGQGTDGDRQDDDGTAGDGKDDA